MADTKKSMIDSVRIVLSKFKLTKDSRLDPDWISDKLDQIRAELIAKTYAVTGVIDHAWLSLPMTLNLYKVNRADDVAVNCSCDVSKVQIPQILTLPSKDGGLDLGIFSLTSTCGTKIYTNKRLSQWNYIPDSSVYSMFGYYDRRNTFLYVNGTPSQLSLVPILLNPEDGKLINSQYILSGSLVSGIVYMVKYAQIIYNNVPIPINTAFTATSTATFLGAGTVYLNSQVIAYRDTDPYPASGDMIRQIELDLLSKEFGIEMNMVNDVNNDSVDDANKGK